MKSIYRNLMLLVLVAIAAGLCFGAPDDGPNASEPDWSAVTGGNWSPWVMTVDGTREWNPVAGFNAWMDTIPVEEKAWPMLADLRYGNENIFDNHWYGGRPDEDAEDWEANRGILSRAESEKIVKHLKVALRRPFMGCPFTEFEGPMLREVYIRNGHEDWLKDSGKEKPNPTLMYCTGNYVTVYSDLAKFATSYAMYRLQEDDADEFVELIGLIYASSRYGYEHPEVIGHLIALAAQDRSADAVSWALERHADRLTEQHLRQLDQVFRDGSIQEPPVLGEVMMLHDSCRRMANNTVAFTIQGIDPERAAIINDMDGEPTHVVFGELHESVRETLLLYEKAVGSGAKQRLFKRDPSERRSDDILEAEKDPLNVLGNSMIGIFHFAAEKMAQTTLWLQEEAGGVRLAIAVHRHKLRHGEFPGSLDLLDEDLVGFEAFDGYTGDPLSYRLTDAGPVIYSYGHDLDDDHGRDVHVEYRRTNKAVDGDFVLFPQLWEGKGE